MEIPVKKISIDQACTMIEESDDDSGFIMICGDEAYVECEPSERDDTAMLFLQQVQA